MDVDAVFDEVVDDLSSHGVLPGALFGARSMTLNGTAFACLKSSAFAVKLDAGSADHAEALAIDGAELFDPSGKGRPFHDWVALPSSHASQWPRWAQAGLDRLADR